MTFPSRKFTTQLTPTLYGIGRSLASGNTRRLARAITKVPDVMVTVTDLLCKVISREFEVVCEHSNSVFRDSSDASLANFSFLNAVTELSEKAPTAWKLLRASVSSQWWQSESLSETVAGRLVMAAACLLKTRNQRMSTLPYIVSVVLHNSGAKKAAYTRLNRLGIAMSHKRTLAKLCQMASHFDASLLCWKRGIERMYCLEQEADFQDSSSDNLTMSNHAISSQIPESYLVETAQHNMQSRHLFQITGDNVDLEIKAKHMTLVRRNKSLHWFNMVATDERVYPPCALRNDGPRRSILDCQDVEFFPSLTEYEFLREEFAVLLARVIVEYLPAFNLCKQSVQDHIQRDHMFETKQKSQRHCLGLLELNENKQQDMVEILQYIHNKYLPSEVLDHDASARAKLLARMQFGGDQLTAERSRNSQRAVINGSLPYQRLEGLIPHAEDFHCMMNFFDLIYAKLYSSSSSSDINWYNV